MKDNRGQISIVMIITVICLIIFGGICIFMLTGENGLFVLKGQEVQNKNEVVNQNTTNTNQEESGNTNTEETDNETNNNEQTNQTDNTNGALTVPMN